MNLFNEEGVILQEINKHWAFVLVEGQTLKKKQGDLERWELNPIYKIFSCRYVCKYACLQFLVNYILSHIFFTLLLRLRLVFKTEEWSFHLGSSQENWKIYEILLRWVRFCWILYTFIFSSQIISRHNVFHRHFYLPEVNN